MSGALPAWVGRAAALGLLAALLLLLWAAAVQPLADRAARVEAGIAEARTLAAALESRLAAAAAETGGAPAEGAALGEVFLVGETDALAAAAAQRRIAAAAEAEGAVIRSVQTLPSEEAEGEGAGTVALRLSLEGGYEAVARTLHRIEAGAPALFVDRLALRAVGDREDEADEVAATIEVSGRRAPEAER